MKKIRVPLIILFTTLAIAFICMEIFLRVYFYVNMNYDIEMWRYAAHLKTPTTDKRSHIHVPGKSMKLMGVDVSINSKGLRDREFNYARTPGVSRILALGDSFTLGWGVPIEQSYSKLLEKNLSRKKPVEVINTGIGNYNLEQETAAYKLEGFKYKPDLVVLFFYLNDAEPTQRKILNWFSKNSYVYAFLNQRWIQLRSLLSPSAQYEAYYLRHFEGASWFAFQQSAKDLTQAVRQNKSKLLVVLIPDLRDLKNYKFTSVHEKVTHTYQSLGVDVIDLLPDLLGNDTSALWVALDDPHPNALTHKKIADKVEVVIKEKGLLP
jgi:lysophospholipase L1-like esterase